MAHIKQMGLDFNYTKFDGLDGKTKCEWNHGDGQLVFQADQNGIMLKGTLNITSMKELQDFAQFLGGQVWTQHRKLAPRILRPGEQ